MGKWRARTSRGKTKNKKRTNAQRNSQRSASKLAEGEVQRTNRIEAKVAVIRPAAELQARCDIQAALDSAAAASAAKRARQPSTPPPPRAKSQAVADRIAERVAARQAEIQRLYQIGHPGSSSSSSSAGPALTPNGLPVLLHPPGLGNFFIPAGKQLGHSSLRNSIAAKLVKAKAKRPLPQPKGSVATGLPLIATSDPYETVVSPSPHSDDGIHYSDSFEEDEITFSDHSQ